MKTLIKYTAVGLLMIMFVTESLVAQEENAVDNRPVREPFSSGILIDNQTSLIPDAGTLEMLIQHRFGRINANGISDLYGIYAPGANIRIGFNYTLIKNLMIGYGITKKNMYSDFQAKYNVIEQTRSNSIPVSVTLYGNMAIDGRNKEVFGQDYKGTHRLSYFGQLIVGKKFNDWLSLQVNTSFTHYNMVDTTYDHDVVGVGISGRIKFSPQSSIIFQYDVPLKIKSVSENRGFEHASLPNFAIGYQASTGTHDFQVYISTADGIVPQDMYMHNSNDFLNGDIMIGFTITRLWNF
ncbi:MAG: DUF5777 family beta-barrel protein [Bacteroidales bacterium]|jgi:hypothetical protein